MLNVYESVDANIRKSWLVIAGFVLFVFLSVYLITKALGVYYGISASGYEFAGLALIIAGISSFISYFYSDRIILSISGARPADRRTDFLFFTVAENLSLAANVPMPKLYIIDDTAMNAFATGRDPQHAVVCATSGLISRLNRTELEGVIGHEFSHIVNYDMRLMSIVTVLVGMITLVGDWLLRANWYGKGRSRDDSGSGGSIIFIAGLLLAALSPLIARLIQLAISRRREYLADAQSVKFTRQPQGLISALTKLGQDTEPLEAANKATAHLYITNPFHLDSQTSLFRTSSQPNYIGRFASLFNTHPPLRDRIAVLEKMK